MMLKFPHARLMVYDCLIQDGLGCVQAIVRSSREFGLISSTDLTSLKLPLETCSCGSMFAARQVLELFLSERGFCPSNGDRPLADKLWRQIEQGVEDYKRETSLVHERRPGEISPTIECSHMAPVVMDVLLQTLMPYA